MTDPDPDPLPGMPHTQPLDGIGQIAGELIHDVANLLSTLDGRLRLALGEARAGRAPLAELERAVEGASELGAMVRDVLGTLREETVSPEVVVEPEQVAHRVLRRALEVCRPAEIRLVSTLRPGTVVRGQPSFLYRALWNLVANAARHAASEIRLSLSHAEGDMVLVAVEDDGPGIPLSEREEIFHPLVRGPGGGTGLGLSSVVWTAAQLGGEVRCSDSAALGGARFDLLLPAALPLASSRAASPAHPFAGRRVLVMDDNPDVRRAVGRFLRRQGAEVLEMDGELEADDKILHVAIRQRPDAIVVDLDLGVRTGVDVWALLRDHFPRLARRVVFLSGFGPGDVLYEAARRTGQRVVSKPFDFHDLTRAVDGVLQAE